MHGWSECSWTCKTAYSPMHKHAPIRSHRNSVNECYESDDHIAEFSRCTSAAAIPSGWHIYQCANFFLLCVWHPEG